MDNPSDPASHSLREPLRHDGRSWRLRAKKGRSPDPSESAPPIAHILLAVAAPLISRRALRLTVNATSTSVRRGHASAPRQQVSLPPWWGGGLHA